ncbi:thioesterase domain-containing protein [Amycolatopsis anabasis]|uniref:thioesterase domain-containing protein n=1 Tax=Amycolatopsis anabasis TaxID=1840409 RepID=UPI00131D60C2|nr:thioesterase domain-containing protein [Amycolatopsis anabasis]
MASDDRFLPFFGRFSADIHSGLKTDTGKNARNSPPASLLLELARGADTRPVVLLPGVGGAVAPYLGLAGALRRHGTVYGIRAHGLVPPEEPDADVGTMVERCLAQLRALPGPPGLLLGWCLGGVLAWELAVRLAGVSRAPEPAVVMVDSFARRDRLSAGERHRFLGRIDRSTARLAAAERRRVRRIADAHLDAVGAHRVTSEFGGEVLLVSCPGGRQAGQPAEWARLAGRLRTRDLHCSRFDVFTGAELPRLAGHIDEFLGEISRV